MPRGVNARTALRAAPRAAGARMPASVGARWPRHGCRAQCARVLKPPNVVIAFFALAASLPALAADTPSRVAELQAEAKTLAPLYKTPLVRDFLAAVPKLPSVEPRTVYRD